MQNIGTLLQFSTGSAMADICPIQKSPSLIGAAASAIILRKRLPAQRFEVDVQQKKNHPDRVVSFGVGADRSFRAVARRVL